MNGYMKKGPNEMNIVNCGQKANQKYSHVQCGCGLVNYQDKRSHSINTQLHTVEIMHYSMIETSSSIIPILTYCLEFQNLIGKNSVAMYTVYISIK